VEIPPARNRRILKTLIKHITAHTYKPLLVRYLSKKRIYRHGRLRLEIPPEVFHPGFFHSTGLLLRYVMDLPLRDKRFLELGAGSGLIAFRAAGEGARVMATDINPIAVEWLRKNSEANRLAIEIMETNLFENIPTQSFDIIAINPPYYKKQPLTAAEHAWYCGEQGEYFEGLFAGLATYAHAASELIMVCCDGCDMEMIESLAGARGWELQCVRVKPTLIEKNFIYKIVRKQ